MADPKTEVDDAFDSPTFGKDGSFRVDKPVGSMSISPCGRDVVLASRQGLHIVDLDSPWTPPRHLPHLTPWEVADVQWSPFASRDYWVVSTSNQKALVWNLAMSTPSASIEHVLHAHTRAITDINFSAHHEDILATCAVDSFVHCWDLRNPACPVITFCDWFAGATQVKWNRQEGHILASAHDKVLRIWDDRKGAHPLRSIVAHSTKIYGIDWNRTETREILTCSLDKTVKLWNYENEFDEPERTLTTPFPIWRARHTPFGQGILAMPQRNDFNVHLYDRRPESAQGPEQSMPCVKQFTGHENHVKEFLWRARGSVDAESDQREWQLVTWGSDLSLRLHRMTDADLGLVGYKRGDTTSAKLLFTRRDAPYKTFREDPGKASSPQLLTVATPHQASQDYESTFDFHRPSVRSIIPSPSTALGGWMSGGFVNSRPSAGARSTAQKDLDPITWMKGVKIGKREPAMEQSLPSVASPDFKMDKAADEFENLGDEITHVGTKFRRVGLSRVEVQKRFLQISLHGPWGPKHAMTYLNCHVEFPADYPQQAHPLVTIEKAATLSDETIGQLQQDAKKLGLAFQAFQKPSFEALIRYLQGEQTLDDLTAWTKDDPDASVYDFAAGSDGSSSDDEDDLGAFVGKQDGDMGMTGSGVLSVSNANVNVPLARTCGAVWSYDGRLTCFFSQKEEVSNSLVGSLGFEDYSAFPRSKRRAYEGLGRLYPPSATVKSKNSSLETMESDESDSDYSSDSSGLSSSSSWLSGQEPGSKRYLNAQGPLRPSISPFQGPEKLADEAHRSNASLSGTKSRSGASKCYISLHNFTDLLPSKPALAASYDLTDPDACAANALTARAHGSAGAAEAWLIIDMILKDAVPLKAMFIPGQLEPLLTNLSKTASGDTTELTASITWGDHPFGKSFLVEELFDHFARLGDIQMLAAMSCVFHDLTPRTKGPMSEFSVSSTRGTFQQPLSAILASPWAISPNNADYFPLTELPAVGRHSISTGKRIKFGSSSLSSSLGAPGSDGGTPFAPVETPPTSSRFSRRSSDQPEPDPFLISSSPERLKWGQRSSSQIATALSSSFHRPFFTASASSSPPNVFPKKKVSPIGSFSAGQIYLPNVVPSRAVSRSMSNAEEPRTGEKSAQAGKSRKNDPAKARIPRFQVRLRNQDQFCDGYSDISLLKASNDWQYQLWRGIYADLLAAWGLSLQRAEVLKFNEKCNYDLDQAPSSTEQASDFIGRRKTREGSVSTIDGNVQLLPFCNLCNIQSSEQSNRTGRCTHNPRRSSIMICLLCQEVIQGRARPCLNCGHVLHAACWDAAASGHEGSSYKCISGCGCRCSEHAQVGGHRVEVASVSTETASSLARRTARETSMGPSASRETSTPPDATLAGDTESGMSWEDVAYESLVKNLGSFRRKASGKPSKSVTGRP